MLRMGLPLGHKQGSNKLSNDKPAEPPNQKITENTSQHWSSSPVTRLLDSLKIYPRSVVQDVLSELGGLTLRELRNSSIVNDVVKKVTLTDALELVPTSEASSIEPKPQTNVGTRILEISAKGTDLYQIAQSLLEQDPRDPVWRDICGLPEASSIRKSEILH